MKYPAVFRDTNTSSSGDSNQQTVLIYQDGDAIHLTGKFKGQYTARWSTFNAINITHEYLANTYGEVVSPEHAEFIIKLAKNAGFAIGIKSIKAMCFEFSVDSVSFYEIPSDIFAHNDESKQITIPLPPKSDINEAGHNLVFAASECKEWPCVNDDVLIDMSGYDVVYGRNVDGLICKVLSIFKDDDTTVYAVNRDGVNYCFIRDLLKKPKTPEEALRDEIIKDVNNAYYYETDEEEFADMLIRKYNITPKD